MFHHWYRKYAPKSVILGCVQENHPKHWFLVCPPEVNLYQNCFPYKCNDHIARHKSGVNWLSLICNIQHTALYFTGRKLGSKLTICTKFRINVLDMLQWQFINFLWTFEKCENVEHCQIPSYVARLLQIVRLKVVHKKSCNKWWLIPP